MCSSQMTRAAVTLSSSLLVFSSMSLSCISTTFCFSSTIFFLWSSTQTIESSRFSLTASSCPILPVTFCHVLRKEGKHEENKSGEKQHGEMMISIHQRMSRGLSVSHTSHSITRNTLLLPNLAKNHQPSHSPWLSQVHQLRPSVMLKNTPTRDLFFRHWWPFSPPPALISLGDVFCPLS